MGYLGYRFRPSTLVAVIGSALFTLACIFCIGGALTLGRIISTAGVIRTTLALQHSRELGLLALVNEETGVRGYVATGKPSFLDVYQSGVSTYALAIKRLDASSSVDASILTQYSDALTSSSLVDQFFRNEVALVASGHAALASGALGQGKTLFDRLRVSEGRLATAIRVRLLHDRATFQRVLDLAVDGTWVAGGVLLLLAIVLVALVRAIRTTEGQAHLDELTGLANRRVFRQRLDLRERCAGVMVLDLDEFKHVNDHFGHQVGDALLISVARRLQAAVRGRDLVARLGGDEFAIVFESDDAATLVVRIRAAFNEPFSLPDNLCLMVGCSIGVGVPVDGMSGADLIRVADEYMFVDKRGHRAVFSPPPCRRVTRSSVAL